MRVDEERKSLDIEQRDVNYLLPAYVRLYLFQTKNIDPDVITFPMFRSVPHPYKKGVMIPIEYAPDDSPIAVEIKADGADIPEATPESEAAADKAEEDYDTIKAKLAEAEAELAKLKEPEEPELTPTEDAALAEQEKAFAEEAAKEKADAAEKEKAEQPPTEAEKGISPAKAAFAEQSNEAPAKESAIAGVGEQPSAERLAKVKEPPGGALPPGTTLDIGGKRDLRDFNRIKKDLMPEKEIKEEEEIEIKEITDIKEPGKEG